jgi:hypothetical protein
LSTIQNPDLAEKVGRKYSPTRNLLLLDIKANVTRLPFMTAGRISTTRRRKVRLPKDESVNENPQPQMIGMINRESSRSATLLSINLV